MEMELGVGLGVQLLALCQLRANKKTKSKEKPKAGRCIWAFGHLNIWAYWQVARQQPDAANSISWIMEKAWASYQLGECSRCGL